VTTNNMVLAIAFAALLLLLVAITWVSNVEPCCDCMYDDDNILICK